MAGTKKQNDIPDAFPASQLEENLRAVRARIERACEHAGREVHSVVLVAVTKNRPASDVDALHSIGVRHVGENRVQEALAKAPSVSVPMTWHMIGHLQKNKAGKALSLFSALHSADSIALLNRLDRRLQDLGSGEPPVPFPVHVQVNMAGEDTKSGLRPEEVPGFLKACSALPRIRAVGLMTMPPWFEDPENARPFFRRLADLAADLSDRGLLPSPPQLSMGMTNDFEIAVEEGATAVRIGSALFA